MNEETIRALMEKVRAMPIPPKHRSIMPTYIDDMVISVFRIESAGFLTGVYSSDFFNTFQIEERRDPSCKLGGVTCDGGIRWPVAREEDGRWRVACEFKIDGKWVDANELAKERGKDGWEWVSLPSTNAAASPKE